MLKDRMLLEIHKKLDFLIWKYSGCITKCPEPQILLETFQRDLDELKETVCLIGVEKR